MAKYHTRFRVVESGCLVGVLLYNTYDTASVKKRVVVDVGVEEGGDY